MSNHTVIKVVFVILSGFLVLYITRDFNRLGSRDERLNMFSRRSRAHNSNDLTIQNNSVFKSHEMNLAGDDDRGDNFDMNFKQMGNITNFGEPKEAIASLQKRHMENVLEKSQIRDDAKSINILKRAKSKKNIKYMYTVGNDIMENKKEIITRLKTGVYDTEENKSKMDISSNQIASGNIGIELEKFKVAPTTNLHHFKSEPGSFKIDEKDEVKKENSKIKEDGLNGERGRKSWKFKVALTRNSHHSKSELRSHKMNGKYENHTENHNMEDINNRTIHESEKFKVAPTAHSFSKSNSLSYKTSKGDNISNDSEIKESELNDIKTINEFASDKFKVAPKAHSFMKSHSLPYKTNRKDSNEKRYEMDESNLNGNNELAPEKIKVAVNAHSKSNSSSYKKFNKDGNDIDDHEIEVIEDDNCPDNRERYILKKLLKKWNSIATQHGITYYLFFGSLLGYHRNGDILPWDTDVDVAVDSRDHRVLRELASPRTFNYKKHDDISRLVVREDLTFPLSRRTRVSCDGRVVERSVDGCSFQDPMARVVRGDRHIDIFAMYALNKTTIHEPTDNLTFDVSQIFPLRSCSFLGIKSKCPAKIASVLRTTYGRGFNIPSKACIDGKWTNRQDVLT